MSLIHNERMKLLANAMDRASTAFIAVGVLGQAFSLAPVEGIRLLSALSWLVGALVLHLAAWRVLGRLRP